MFSAQNSSVDEDDIVKQFVNKALKRQKQAIIETAAASLDRM